MPPVPISATHIHAPFSVTITFDQLLQVNPAAPAADWAARHNNGGQGNPTVSVPGTNQVILSGWTPLGPDPGPDEISYVNNVDALKSMAGVPVASFANLPYT